MNNQMVPTDNNERFALFFYLLFLTVFLLLFEISYFIQSNQHYFSKFSVISGTLNFPLKIVPGIIYFIFIQLVLHLAFCWLTWVVACQYVVFFKLPTAQWLKAAIGIWVLATCTLLLCNMHYYPNSKFSSLLNFLGKIPYLSYVLLGFALTMCGGVVFITIFMTLKKYSFFYLAILLAALGNMMSSQFLTTVESTKTNIILIGIDSLRPDFLGFFGGSTKTDFLDGFLKQAAVFSESVTPLARTYPSWISILTGQYPKEVGVRTNLTNSYFSHADTLAQVFKKQGFKTVYATDETRFSNIDQHLGFDQLIAPPMGLNDFLVGSFNDFPISNLLINTSLGKWLFPYSYANRGVYFSYDPNSFLRRITSALAYDDKPLFLAMHFCLPHFPFTWREKSLDKDVILQYQASIARVDQQIKDLFGFLQKKKILDNAMVVLFSDHGEALELPGDRITEVHGYQGIKQPTALKFYPSTFKEEGLNQSAGHGTDVLGLPQYHTVLAFRSYGSAKRIEPRVLPGIVSVMDIKPTLIDWMGNKQPKLKPTRGGQSLLPSLLKGASVPRRHIFLESDFSPASMRTIYPQLEKVLLDGISLFRVDPQSTRLIVKADMGEKIIKTKQYADIYENWILAYYPQANHKHIPILVNLKTGEWSDDWSSSFVRHSPAQSMAKALKNFYGDEIRN